MELFDIGKIPLTKYLFFTGKGGVGKTSVACATAVTLADKGEKVLLISTDPASNLQDVFNTELTNKGKPIDGLPGLVVANLDPIQAAAEYREGVVAPYRGKLPESAINNMEEQLSGSCTVEIAAFNEFSNCITDEKAQAEYDLLSSIPRPPATLCACCSYLPHGVISSAKALTARRAWVEDEDESLGSRMEIEEEKCTGCRICVPLCCGECIEVR